MALPIVGFLTHAVEYVIQNSQRNMFAKIFKQKQKDMTKLLDTIFDVKQGKDSFLFLLFESYLFKLKLFEIDSSNCSAYHSGQIVN